MQETKEWGLVLELMEIIRSIDSESQQEFITDLFTNLEPSTPFLEQCSQKQLDYLHAIYDKYCNDNEDAFEDWEE